MWNQDLNVFSQKYRVIAPDLPGFGESALGLDTFSMERCADALWELLDELRIKEKIVLLGLSMGGYIAFEFVRKYPERLKALVLVATHPFPDNDTTRQARYETAEFVRREGASALAERLIPRFLGKTTQETKPHVVNAVRQLIVSNSPESIAAACLGLASRSDSSPLLRDIRVPTLVIAGDEDILIPGEQTAQIQKRIAGSRITSVRQCGHLINLEQPQEFQNTVLHFLAEVS
jgi:pimeloyl-ACP methyl ester carboxylesterase